MCVCVQAVVVSIGYDTLGTDPEVTPGAGMALAPPDFKEMGEMLRGLRLPLLYIQEGGYDMDGLGVAATHLFAVAE